MLIFKDAVERALKKAKPGTPEFRTVMRDEIRNVKELVGTQGIYNFKAGSPYGLDQRAVILVKVEKGAWKLMTP